VVNAGVTFINEQGLFHGAGAQLRAAMGVPRLELINPKRANFDVQLLEQGAGDGRAAETAGRRTTSRAAMPPARS
jgi:hypothetical protein